MSGTSMDGVDISYCSYNSTAENIWEHTVIQTKTIEYPIDILNLIKKSTSLNSNQLLELDKILGKLYGQFVNEFIHKYKIDKKDIDAIASHGHTIFHQPEKGYTYQIGCGDTIAFNTGLKVINDFRQKDVVAGGQGAPLVPIGDLLLFSRESSTFLNLGGFANCCKIYDEVIAFDISPANLPMNEIVQELGFDFDINGNLASTGKLIQDILDELNELDYYSQLPPKSLGTEWLKEHFTPIIKKIKNPNDRLRTIVEHISIQITRSLSESKSIYVTGGGAMNTFLINRIKHHFKGQIIIPPAQIVDFKEAIVFGFLGSLYLAGVPNTISSVTGASKETIGGVLHLP